DVDISESEVTAHGEITIKGVTRPVEVTGTATAPLADPWGNDRIGLRLAAAVDRTEFGVSWNNPLPSGEPALANDVRIVTDLQFVKAS
ncbi:MAG TPA: YceI family protein, partial [Gaiellaceae bacterium]|nr:YceI family protein [Gaiellaceae bacterium]